MTHDYNDQHYCGSYPRLKERFMSQLQLVSFVRCSTFFLFAIVATLALPHTHASIHEQTPCPDSSDDPQQNSLVYYFTFNPPQMVQRPQSPPCNKDEVTYCVSNPCAPSQNECCQKECFQKRCCNCYGPTYLYVSHVEGDSIAFRNGYTSLGLFTVLGCQQCNFQPFIDVRGHIFNNGKKAANLGGGFRYFSCLRNSVYGVNAYYDYREGRSRDFHQIGVGLELLGPCWDLRVNGYLPIGKKIGEDHAHKFPFNGGQFAICRQRQEALTGFDAEIGKCFCICLPQRCCIRELCLYVAAGPYYYDSRSCAHNIWGGQARVALRKCCFDFEVGATYDPTYRSSAYARIAINIPFSWPCGESACCGCNYICEPVHRQEMIVLSKEHCSWRANF